MRRHEAMRCRRLRSFEIEGDDDAIVLRPRRTGKALQRLLEMRGTVAGGIRGRDEDDRQHAHERRETTQAEAAQPSSSSSISSD
jgi:hypothetical protein